MGKHGQEVNTNCLGQIISDHFTKQVVSSILEENTAAF